MSLSTHVLDATSGRPAAGLTVRWESRGDGGWTEAQAGETDDDGRLRGWQPGTGVHRLVFDTGAWFARTGTVGFYPEVAITFEVTAPDQHYHVPLLLSPFAYSTYRGS
jgi:5-hydroxyisourate hydrolase